MRPRGGSARAPNGRIAAAPPRSAMNSRRLTIFSDLTIHLDCCVTENSGQRRIIEKRFPGERLAVGLVELSILEELADRPEVLAKECRIRQLINVLIRHPQVKFPGGEKCRQDCRLEITDIVRPF